jgi:hypothetical protein
VLDAEERRLYLAPESLPARGSVTTTSRWHLAARKEARWNRPVFQRVIDDRGEEWGARETNRLQLFPALGTACPPAPLEDLPAINTYWEEQCQERQLLATWHGMGHSLLDDVQNVVISLRHYRVSVTFGAGSIRHPDDPSRTRLETREAIRTVARRQPGPSTRETDPERATPGSPSTDRP